MALQTNNGRDIFYKIHKIHHFDSQNLVAFFRQQKGGFRVSKNSTHKIGDLVIFTFPEPKQFSSQIFNIPNLNSMQEWNQDYFNRLIHSMNNITIIDEQQIDQQSQNVIISKSAVVRDMFCEDQVYLLRCKLIEEYAKNPTDDLWKFFQEYNREKFKQEENLKKQNQNLRFDKNKKIKILNNTLEQKEEQKNQIKGKLSALLHQKKMKMNQFGQQFQYNENDFNQQSDNSKPDYFSGSQQQRQVIGSIFDSSSQPYLTD